VIDDLSMTWFNLRERRSSLAARSKLAETAARRQTFAAAMTQFEEQMTAAKVVTPATRPLNLYYGLAQAGMAIAAAHAPDPWSFSRHGLKLGDTNADLTDIQVTPEGEGAFQRVAAATGSSTIAGPVSPGTVWASLPDLGQGARLPGSTAPIPVDLLVSTFYKEMPRATVYLDTELPEDDRDAWLKRFGEIMANYPSAEGWAIPVEENAIQLPPRRGGRWAVTVEWRTPPPFKELSEEEIEIFFDGIAPEYRYRDDRYLRPSVEDDGKQPPSPLMTWWLLLYSFSMLARYQPRKWVQLLDLDKSENAVPLQYALELALSVIPHLVLEALDGKPRLLSKPVAF
jgi:YaaC-like Protein